MRTSFSAWPEHYQRETLRKLAYVQAVDLARDAHRDVLCACKATVPGVFTENRTDWDQKERDAARDADAAIRHREGREHDYEVPFKAVEEPKPSTVRDWYSAWLAAGRDTLSLMPLYHLRGNRTPRFDVAEGEGGTDTYKLMEEATKSAYLDLVKRSKQIAFEVYEKLCKKAGIAAASSRTFRRFIQKRYDDYERYSKRHGRKKAFLKFGIFSLRDLPDKQLQEVEVDHCLIDLVVADAKDRALGRPWITVLLDRATKCILGIHVSFMPPGHATVQRAVMHALFKKDLSAFPGLKHDWPCYGLIEWLISDRGKEFLSHSFRNTCNLLGIFPIALPGRRPWLKGSVERIFRTMHVRVFDLHEGTTKAKDSEVYHPAKRARITRAELDLMIAEWIVDDYHETPHPALQRKYKKAMTPREAWDMLVARHPLRFAPDPITVYQLTCEIFTRQISNTGIRIKNHLYVDAKLLERLIRRPGGLERDWTFRRDRLNLSRIWVWDEDAHEWLPIPNADPEIGDNATEIMFSMWKGAARDMTPEGKPVDVDALRRGREHVEGQREAALAGKAKVPLRWVLYGEMGSAFTPPPDELKALQDDRCTPPVIEHAAPEPDPVDGQLPNGADGATHGSTNDVEAGSRTVAKSDQSALFENGIDDQIAEMMRRMG